MATTGGNGGPAPSASAPQGQAQLSVLGPNIKDFSFENPNAGTVLFAFDLTFAGVFRVQNVPAETLQPIVMIECPRLLFPFAREIVATSVRNGGFPPLLLDPVDFVALYQQRAAQTQAAQPTPTSS